MIRTDAEWLRRLADAVESGECEVGRAELTIGVLLAVLKPGSLDAPDALSAADEAELQRLAAVRVARMKKARRP